MSRCSGPVALRGVSPIVVRTISAADHRGFIGTQRSVSFLQTPAWAAVKSEWRSESIGWFRDDILVGAGLVLYRQLPKVKRYLAYLPEGPTLDWGGPDVGAALAAMQAYLTTRGAFAIRMGPPVAARTWSADSIKTAIADDDVRKLSDVPADEHHSVGESVRVLLKNAGWRHQGAAEGFSSGQPQYVFQIPLRGRTPEDLLAGMNQLWRRNIKKAVKQGVEVTQGTAADLRAFHELYRETAQRDHFTPRPLAYFETMFEALRSEDPDRIRLYLAYHEGDLVAATTLVKVGTHAWYSYGASSTAKREVRGSNAIQWQMITDALAAGADVYDLRGITDTLDPDDPHVGLIQFKVGTGGQAVEYVGEWDLPLNALIYRAFAVYMSRR
jgi:lipid II:glycine glycyltransferase (peptidoglycan interpeptide bridge formation enzyme)